MDSRSRVCSHQFSRSQKVLIKRGRDLERSYGVPSSRHSSTRIVAVVATAIIAVVLIVAIIPVSSHATAALRPTLRSRRAPRAPRRFGSSPRQRRSLLRPRASRLSTAHRSRGDGHIAARARGATTEGKPA